MCISLNKCRLAISRLRDRSRGHAIGKKDISSTFDQVHEHKGDHKHNDAGGKC